jgi:histidinol-phosphatase (PHP family)
MLAAAREVGLCAVLMSEHLSLPEDLDPERTVSPGIDDFIEFAAAVSASQDIYPGLEVGLAAEADWLPGREAEMVSLRRVASEAGVRVFLGSIHFLDGWAFDDPNRIGEWDDCDVNEVWRGYFAVWCDMARSGHYDVLAHPDLVKKFGHRPTFDTRELFAEAARAAREGGALIEVSTAGLRKPVCEIYPSPELLQAFSSAGVPATVGSDAHAPADVGRDIESAYAALVQAGYREVGFPRGEGEVRWVQL